MCRAGQRLVIATLLLAASSAHAWHSGAMFDKSPGAGGGGGLYFTGAKADRGWDCRACHVKPEGKITMRLGAEPASLFTGFKYRAGQVYRITLTLDGEHRGKASTRSNFNGFALRILDAQGRAAGQIVGFSADEIVSGAPTTIASTGKEVGVTRWVFSWEAPPTPGTGSVSIFLGAVDGDGAGSPPDKTLNDPFGDDVFFGVLKLDEER